MIGRKIFKEFNIKKPNDIILIFGTHYVAKEVFQKFEISFDSGVI